MIHVTIHRLITHLFGICKHFFYSDCQNITKKRNKYYNPIFWNSIWICLFSFCNVKVNWKCDMCYNMFWKKKNEFDWVFEIGKNKKVVKMGRARGDRSNIPNRKIERIIKHLKKPAIEMRWSIKWRSTIIFYNTYLNENWFIVKLSILSHWLQRLIDFIRLLRAFFLLFLCCWCYILFFQFAFLFKRKERRRNIKQKMHIKCACPFAALISIP